MISYVEKGAIKCARHGGDLEVKDGHISCPKCRKEREKQLDFIQKENQKLNRWLEKKFKQWGKEDNQ